jgi:hypothetical protein
VPAVEITAAAVPEDIELALILHLHFRRITQSPWEQVEQAHRPAAIIQYSRQSPQPAAVPVVLQVAQVSALREVQAVVVALRVHQILVGQVTLPQPLHRRVTMAVPA